MLRIIKHLFFFSLLASLIACEKVINIDTADGSGLIVIEGVVSNKEGTCRVLVSNTRQFSDDNEFLGIAGATVTITEENGPEITLAETSPGIYEAATFTGTPGKKYTMNVLAEGKNYTSTSTMPVQVFMDTAFIEEEALFGETRKFVRVEYTDPRGLGNRYRFIQYVNNVKENNLFIRSDEYSDGNQARFLLRYFTDDEEDNLKSGDDVLIQMMCIDQAVYKYWYSLEQGATGDGNAASPANPVSNISGGALGYFSARTLEEKVLEVE